MSITDCGSKNQSIVCSGSSGILSNFGTSTIINNGPTGPQGSMGSTCETGGTGISSSNANFSYTITNPKSESNGIRNIYAGWYCRE